MIVEIVGDDIYYAYVKSSEKISWSGWIDVDDLDSDDTAYTRYPDLSANDRSYLTGARIKQPRACFISFPSIFTPHLRGVPPHGPIGRASLGPAPAWTLGTNIPRMARMP